MAAVIFLLGAGRAAVIGAISLLGALDHCLIAVARPLGAGSFDARLRYARFLGSYAAIYALACLPVLDSLGRWIKRQKATGADEKRRSDRGPLDYATRLTVTRGR